MLWGMAFPTMPSLGSRFVDSPKSSFAPSALLAGGGAMIGGWALLHFIPSLELEMFAGGAARLVGLFTGVPIVRGEDGWSAPLADAPITITSACSATDYFIMVAGLIGFHLARRGTKFLPALFLGIGAALPVTLFVNVLRIITVAYAHPWIISRLPVAYESFLHMTVGAAVFLPSLVALNLLLETYARHRRSAAA
jgi:exosortase/archaeosortase family protein